VRCDSISCLSADARPTCDNTPTLAIRLHFDGHWSGQRTRELCQHDMSLSISLPSAKLDKRTWRCERVWRGRRGWGWLRRMLERHEQRVEVCSVVRSSDSDTVEMYKLQTAASTRQRHRRSCKCAVWKSVTAEWCTCPASLDELYYGLTCLAISLYKSMKRRYIHIPYRKFEWPNGRSALPA